ncbi:MAG: hypothetical protein K8F91_12790 [Candidatus Obscuribacterales bacterium]|nr:hypothetical protein [Candidatus Obscuribacterales bacterium]
MNTIRGKVQIPEQNAPETEALTAVASKDSPPCVIQAPSQKLLENLNLG